MKPRMSIAHQRGSVLLFAISGIAMIAALVIGLFYMTSSTATSQAGGSGMNRAHYLALAGKDYALAHWNERIAWNNAEFTLSDTDRFKISYFRETITATGIVNKDTPFEASKTIVAPCPSRASRHWIESFADLSKWDTGTQVGSFTTPTVSGDKALQATSAQSAFGSYGAWSWLQFNTGAAGVDFSPQWLNADRCLSHDLQVKIMNNDGEPYYFAGLIMKAAGIGDNREFYGISFMRTKQRGSSCWSFCLCSSWTRDDNIPSELKPTSNGSDGIFSEPLTYGWNGSYCYRYSQPSLVLWKRQNNAFAWLAYKLMPFDDDNQNYVVNSNNCLTAWSNMQVRLMEAHPLSFTNGGPDPLLHHAIVTGPNGTARISGTPIVTAGKWSDKSAEGILTLTNINGTFGTGEDLLVNGVVRAKVSGAPGEKTNYIRVYYGDEGSHGTPNDNPRDNDRGGNPRIVSGSGVVHWPVANVSDWSAANDYMTLVQWDGVNSAVIGLQRLGGDGTKEENAVIQDRSLLTPASGPINYSGIGLHATGNTAVSTYFDDFAVQY